MSSAEVALARRVLCLHWYPCTNEVSLLVFVLLYPGLLIKRTGQFTYHAHFICLPTPTFPCPIGLAQGGLHKSIINTIITMTPFKKKTHVSRRKVMKTSTPKDLLVEECFLQAFTRGLKQIYAPWTSSGRDNGEGPFPFPGTTVCASDRGGTCQRRYPDDWRVLADTSRIRRWPSPWRALLVIITSPLTWACNRQLEANTTSSK